MNAYAHEQVHMYVSNIYVYIVCVHIGTGISKSKVITAAAEIRVLIISMGLRLIMASIPLQAAYNRWFSTYMNYRSG